MMRYFLIAISHKDGTCNMSVTTRYRHPSNEEIRRNAIAQLDVVAPTIMNIHEFKSEQDYKDFWGDKIK